MLSESADREIEDSKNYGTVEKDGLVKGDLSDESWREYDWFIGQNSEGGVERRIYRIDEPVEVYFRRGGATHRVVGPTGIVHCVPAPGEKGCVLRWCNKEDTDPVKW